MRKIKTSRLPDLFFLKVAAWVGGNKLKIAVFTFFSLIVVGASYLPYFNLILNKTLVIFLIIVIFIFSFRLNWKVTLCLSIGFLIISYFFTILGLISLAEMIGDYIYGLLVLVVIGFFSAI